MPQNRRYDLTNLDTRTRYGPLIADAEFAGIGHHAPNPPSMVWSAPVTMPASGPAR